MQTLPKKLKVDSILEALIEFRFEHNGIPEIVIGRLADSSHWKGYSQTRLPAASMPNEIRVQNPNLFFQPSIQLTSPDNRFLVRIGPNVASIHNVKPYAGWHTGFHTAARSLIEDVFSLTIDCKIVRIGLRYLNLLTPEAHNIHGVFDLELKLTYGREQFDGQLHLNRFRKCDPGMTVHSQIVSPEIVQGIPFNSNGAFVDIDVYTEAGFELKNLDEAHKWLISAHEVEKEEFFNLLSLQNIAELTEE